MIDFHYWPTPNGGKISIALEALEAMELPYRMIPVDIGRGAPISVFEHLYGVLDRRLAGRDPQGAVDRSRRLLERAALVRRAERAPCAAPRLFARQGTSGLR